MQLNPFEVNKIFKYEHHKQVETLKTYAYFLSS